MAVRACATQIRYHVAPAWNRTPPPVVFLPANYPSPPGSYVIDIFDTADQADALGYHYEDDRGLVLGKVFVNPILDNHGTALTGELSVAAVLSHETCEAFIDPSCATWADNASGGFDALEACDAVETDSYTIGATPVSVSNFLLPAWFDTLATGPKDHLGLCKTAFEVRPGGYTLVSHGSTPQPVFGDRYPEWRKAGKTHPLSRTARRIKSTI